MIPRIRPRDARPFEPFLVFLSGVSLGLVPCLFYPGFYFINDMQHEYMPVFYNIGRTLRMGALPILSLTNWYGGNYLAEYQYGLLNPVSLSVYAVLPSIPSVAWAAAAVASFYQGVLASGMFFLARTYGISRAGAGLAALVVATGNLTDYWYAASWEPGLISLAWFVWAWAFLLRAHRAPASWLGAVVFSYLALTAGWPHTVVVLTLLALMFGVQAWKEKPAAGRLTALAFLAACLLSVASFLPLLSTDGLNNRAAELWDRNAFVPNLYDVLAMSAPFGRGIMMNLTGYGAPVTPLFFCAWFLFPLLPLIQWRRMKWREPDTLGLAVLAALMLIATQGPEHIGGLRWPFRFIPYLHMAVVLLFLKAMQAPLRTGSRPVLLAFAAVALSGLISWQAWPPDFLMALAGTAACFAGLVAFLQFYKENGAGGYAVLAAVAFVLFVVTRAVTPYDVDLNDLHANPARGETPLVNPAPHSYTIYLGTTGNTDDPARLAEFQTGYMPLEAGIASIGGYSPVGHGGLARALCMQVFGQTCPEAANLLFAIDPETNAPLIDLFRIDRIIAMKGPFLDNLLPYVKNGWRLASGGRYTQSFTRDLPNAGLPGTVSWISPHMEVAETGEARPLREKIFIARRDGTNDRVTFARAWWPGYSATFAGQSVPVHAADGVFVTADLPPAPESGVLELEYDPPYLAASVAAAILGLALCGGIVLFRRRVFRLPKKRMPPVSKPERVKGIEPSS